LVLALLELERVRAHGGELRRGSGVFLIMARIFFSIWLAMLLVPPVGAAAQSVDYAHTLEQARELGREPVTPAKEAEVGAPPRASVLDGARAQPFGVKPVLPNPGNRLGVRVDTEAAAGLRPYLAAGVEAPRLLDGLPAPTLELGASVPTDRDGSVSAGVRQTPPAAGVPAPPPVFQFGIERRF